jgi:hypothetical protein
MNGMPYKVFRADHWISVEFLGSAGKITFRCEDDDEAIKQELFWQDVIAMAENWDSHLEEDDDDVVS